MICFSTCTGEGIIKSNYSKFASFVKYTISGARLIFPTRVQHRING